MGHMNPNKSRKQINKRTVPNKANNCKLVNNMKLSTQLNEVLHALAQSGLIEDGCQGNRGWNNSLLVYLLSSS